MAYTTHSNSSPENNTSYINTGLVSLIPNNPYHPSATTINWPTNYDLFVNKTNDQQVSVSVSDETHKLSEIDTLNNSGLYLNHRPKLGTTIVPSPDGVIDSGLTDHNHGIIYFSTLPAANFTMTYLADPDKYYGEYLTQMQDVLHKVEIWAGAGNTVNEGVRSAEILVNTTNSKIDDKLPNKIHIANLGKNITFQSDAADTVGNNINLGNGYDTVTVNANSFNVFRGTFDDGSTLDPITSTITDHSGDICNLVGLVNMSPTGITRATGITYDMITGALFTTESGRDGGDLDALRVFGDVFVAGDIFTMGNHTVQNVTTTSSLNVFEDNMLVKGHSYLGDAAADRVYVGGDLVVSGRITQEGFGTHTDVTINRDIILGNHSATQPSLVDGLDPSYIANRHIYMRPAGPDWCGDTVNQCSIGQLIDGGTATGGSIEGLVSHETGANNVVIDTGITGKYMFTGPEYYAGRFDDGTWILDVSSGPDAGAKIPIAAWDSTITGWILSRSLASMAASGMTYRVNNPYFCEPDFVTATTTEFSVSASAVNPIIANVRGIVKSNIVSDNISVDLGSAGKKYLFLANENSVAAVGLESDGVWSASDYDVPSDKSIIVAEATAVGSGPYTLDTNSVITYRRSGKYDSTWRRYASSSAVFNHNLGGTYRSQDYKITVSEAAAAGTPGTIRAVPLAGSAGSYYVSAITPTTMSMTVPTNTWIRVKIEV
jgi:hypothetical protein